MAEQLQYLDSLNSRNTLFLIRQPSTGRILTGRRVTPEQMEIYAKIREQQAPHVPMVRDIIREADGQYFVLQDYIQGITLEQLLAKQHFLSYAETAHIGVQLCLALEKLHAAGIIHRDIKPANVMITADNEVYLIDFDISRVQKENRNADTRILGTKGYAAPEQFGFQQTDARTDIYALGILLNQMCTGEFPQTQLAGRPLAQIIRKCTEIDPQKRYAGAAEVKKALEAGYPECRAGAVAQNAAPAAKKTGIPGFRSGNPVHILLAVLGYGVFAVFAIAAVSAAFVSVSNFIVTSCMIAIPVGCYLFGFDLFGVRTRCQTVERYRRTRYYPFYCICLIAAWILLCVFVMFLGAGIFASSRAAA